MRRVVLVGLLAAVPAVVASQQPAPTNLFVIRDVRVFDGQRTIERADVMVQDGTIRAVSREGESAQATGTTTVEGRGRTLVPGFIDGHVHFADDARSALEQAAVMGVTTMLDMFSAGERLKTLKRIAAEDPDGLADVRTAAIGATAPGGHPTQMGGPAVFPTLTRAEDADAFVEARVAEGADYIKIVYDDLSSIGPSLPMLSRSALDALIAAAHRRRKLAVVHALSEPRALEAIEAGADVLVHLFIGPTASSAFGTTAAKHRVAIIPTLSVLCPPVEAPGLLADPHLGPFIRLPWRRMLEMPGRKVPCLGAEATLKQLAGTEVSIIAGTDAPSPGTAYGASMHGELSLLVRSGLSPTQALAAATSVPARVFQLADRGNIRPGLRADLVLVEGDPTRDILATRRIVSVWKRGVAVRRANASN